MTDPMTPEERIVEIEERLEAWPDDGALVVYAPDDIPYLLEVAKAARELIEGQDRGGAEVTLRRGMDRLRDALHRGGDDGGK